MHTPLQPRDSDLYMVWIAACQILLGSSKAHAFILGTHNGVRVVDV